MHQLSISIIILAAGYSKRLGEPKQLLEINGQNLLSHAIRAATDVNAETVILVAREGLIDDQAQGKYSLVINEDASLGMSSSIKAGLKFVYENAPGTDGVIIMVCDQPHVTTAVLLQLINEHVKTGKSIVAAKYANTYGTPVFFDKLYFSRLNELNGDSGAKKVILQNFRDLAFIEFPLGEIDIDTPEDWKNFRQ